MSRRSPKQRGLHVLRVVVVLGAIVPAAVMRPPTAETFLAVGIGLIAGVFLWLCLTTDHRMPPSAWSVALVLVAMTSPALAQPTAGKGPAKSAAPAANRASLDNQAGGLAGDAGRFRPVATPPSVEPGVSVDVVGFGEVTLSEADVAVTPGGRVVVDGPIAFGQTSIVRGYTRLDITALPGDSIDLTSVETFKAAELTLGLYRPIGRLKVGPQEIVTSVLGEYGFATRLPHTPAPLERYPRQLGVGVLFQERTSGSWISLRYGRAQVAGDVGYGQWMVAGSVPLGPVRLGGDAVLSVGAGVLKQRDMVRLWVGTSIPDLIAVIRR